jgi:hypothetical protein
MQRRNIAGKQTGDIVSPRKIAPSLLWSWGNQSNPGIANSLYNFQVPVTFNVLLSGPVTTTCEQHQIIASPIDLRCHDQAHFKNAFVKSTALLSH